MNSENRLGMYGLSFMIVVLGAWVATIVAPVETNNILVAEGFLIGGLLIAAGANRLSV